MHHSTIKGRGASFNPPNRFEEIHVEPPPDDLDLFLEWLQRDFPERAAKITNRIRGVREGRLTESEFGKRMTGRRRACRSHSSIL